MTMIKNSKIKNSKILILNDNTMLIGEVSKIEKNDSYLVDWPIIITMIMDRTGRTTIRLLAYPLGIEAVADFSTLYGVEIAGNEVRAIVKPTIESWREYENAVKVLYSALDVPTGKDIIQFS